MSTTNLDEICYNGRLEVHWAPPRADWVSIVVADARVGIPPST